MFIEWSEDYSVGISEIDQQHKQFILIINELYDTLEVGSERIMLGSILDQLVAYADFHFRTEEKYFRRFHYELTDEHIKLHRELRAKITDFVMKFDKDPEKYALELLHFLKDWLAEHFLEEDMKYAKCFHEHGMI